MKKQLIALRGPSNAGKSTTLHILYKLLLAPPSTKPIGFKKIGYKIDFSAIVAINGIKIGIVNRGDVTAPLKKLIDHLAAENCKIIVCAARTKGNVGTMLDSFSPRFKLVTVSKHRSETDKDDVLMLANQAAAHQLAANVYSALIA
ncbi:MAG: hypothetical protein ACN6O2_14385 [Stenotrophomonas sp.]|uniref:hypothetical protein n=1 Tax=Stenotrophomonas sp. TaxID=69392 RepID=UPI0028B075A7|nr:hypothetical protein [Stenotrophomonas sp.]